jgi:hypothetical protein
MTARSWVGTAVAFVCASCCVTACSSQFGRAAPMVIVAIDSAKPDRNYYFLTLTQAETYFVGQSRTVLLGSSSGLESLLSIKVWQTTNEPGMPHTAGEYALVVKCDHAYKLFPIFVPYAPSVQPVTQTVDCDGS